MNVHIEKKQKIILILTIVAFGFLAWQIYSLVRGDVSTKPTVADNATAVKTAVVPAPVVANNAAPTNNAMVATTASPAPSVGGMPAPTPANLPDNMDASRSAMASGDQKQYLNIINQYELAKMQHRLLEEQVAIVTARQQIADMQQKIAKAGGVNNSMFGGAATDDYQLSYLDQRNGEWSATLVKQGEFHTVKLGTVLPDGRKVVALSAKGVILERGNMKKLVTFQGSTTTPAVSAPPFAPEQSTLMTPPSLPAAMPAPQSTQKSVTPPVPSGMMTAVPLPTAAPSNTTMPNDDVLSNHPASLPATDSSSAQKAVLNK